MRHLKNELLAKNEGIVFTNFHENTTNLNNYFDFHVRLSIRVCVCLFVRSFVCSFVCPKKTHFLRSYHKMSLIKFACCVSSMKNMHPQTPVGPLLSEAKPSYVYSILKAHGQSSRYQVKILSPSKTKVCI